jgi:hypothetical protein
MKKTILAAVPLALLALAVPSAAQAKRAVTYKAKLAPSAESAVRGKAKLVDGKRRDKLQLRVKGLEAGATYGWALRKAPAGGDACGGEDVGAFSYAELKGRRGKARSRARAFSGGSGAYAVVVTDAAGQDVACLVLKSKAQRKAEREQAKPRHDGTDDDEAGLDDDELGDDSSGDEDEDLAEDEPYEDEPVEDEPLDDELL